jgi:glycosyl transferase family 87
MASNAVERCAPRGYSGYGGTEGLGAARGLLDRQSRMVAASCLLRASRLQLYGYAVAAVYALFLVSVYRAGTWILDARGMPIYTDFACAWIAALQAIHGQAASLYDPAKFIEMQAALVGPSDYFYPNWPYPPSFFLILAPFAVLRYSHAFLVWDVLTLLGCVIVVYSITRRPAAIALVLAFPFTVWNFLAGQNGFLTASLLGASLLFLERRPVLAGVFIGCLTCKPQFGVLFPVALFAARQWRTVASATITAALLAGAALAAFGAGGWVAFPRELVAQAGLNLLADADSNWGALQTTYGFARSLQGGAALAWLAQAAVTSGVAVVVWLVWRSQARYPLKAAALSAGALIASPYAFAYDLAAIAIPVAFLARDQISYGFLRGEQAIAVALFGVALAVLIAFGDRPGGTTFGSTPVGTLVAVTLFGVIVRRTSFNGRHPRVSDEDGSRQLSAMADRGGIPSLAR